jgi:hypothetical protein
VGNGTYKIRINMRKVDKRTEENIKKIKLFLKNTIRNNKTKNIIDKIK